MRSRPWHCRCKVRTPGGVELQQHQPEGKRKRRERDHVQELSIEMLHPSRMGSAHLVAA
jgi:hypothetical protein